MRSRYAPGAFLTRLQPEVQYEIVSKYNSELINEEVAR